MTWSEKLKIRYADDGDRNVLKGLWHILIAETGRGSASTFDDKLEHALRCSSAHVKVCEYDSIVAGTASLDVHIGTSLSRYGWINSVITRPEYRRKGVGSALIRDLIAVAVSDSCSEVRLACSFERIPFYRRFSFKPVQEISDGYIMSLAL